MIASDWQGSIAIFIVLMTAGTFIWRALRPKGPGCHEGCGCTPAKATTAPPQPEKR